MPQMSNNHMEDMYKIHRTECNDLGWTQYKRSSYHVYVFSMSFQTGNCVEMTDGTEHTRYTVSDKTGRKEHKVRDCNN
jgi:hypothetical protein